jgi:hypothetical protein
METNYSTLLRYCGREKFKQFSHMQQTWKKKNKFNIASERTYVKKKKKWLKQIQGKIKLKIMENQSPWIKMCDA